MTDKEEPASQREMREWENGTRNFDNFVRNKSKRMNPFLENYGKDNELRMSGECETAIVSALIKN